MRIQYKNICFFIGLILALVFWATSVITWNLTLGLCAFILSIQLTRQWDRWSAASSKKS